MRKKTLLLLVPCLLSWAPGCSQQSASTPRDRLSPEEKTLLSSLPIDENISVVSVSSSGSIQSHHLLAGEFDEFHQQALVADPEMTLALDLPVLAQFEEEPVNEELLYSGKEEFGLDEWVRLHPLADGRGVTIGVADDGVALGRPGLMKASTGAAKIIRSISPASIWNILIRSERPACVPESRSAALLPQWKWEDSGLQPWSQASIVMPFDITSCGSPQSGAPLSRSCADWSKLLPEKLKTSDSRYVVHAALVEYGSGTAAAQTRIVVDLNGDSAISKSEVFEPLSQNPSSYHLFSTGEALAFDVHDAAKIGPLPLSCTPADAAARVLNIITPELAGSSHGEGVASVAAGHRIAGRPFDGVAPGAAIVDVRFSDPVGTEAYSIAELARILRIAGQHSDLVNLSFSLFFSSPTAQIAMNRVLESALRDTPALYFFSAGNNGPGRGSMNRALLYPSMGIPVGAWLNGRMSQTVFGSPTPMPGVVSYSSRGPGPDGFGGALLLSPLAAMAAGPAGDGVKAFSGTSSATPALTGFAARIVSQIRAEGLPWSRDLLRQSLIEGAVPVEGAPFIDQGFGIPRLVKVMEAYRRLSASSRKLPALRVTGESPVHGISQKGISVRGDRNRSSRYGFRLEAGFTKETPEQEIADYAESLTFEASAPWIRVAPNRLLGRSPLRIEIAPDWSQIEKTPGEHLGEVVIRNADSRGLRAVIPVTVLIPEPTTPVLERELTLEANQIHRLFLAPPSWARAALMSIESADPLSPICGQTSLYDPAGVKQVALSTQNGSFRREQAFAIRSEGIQEWITDAGRSHSSCPFQQRLTLRIQWVGVESALVDAEAVEQDKPSANVRLRLMLRSGAPVTRGSVRLHRPGLERSFFLTPGAQSFHWKSSDRLDFSQGVNRFRFTEEFETRQALLHGYSYLALQANAAVQDLAGASLGVVDGWWQLPKETKTDSLNSAHLEATGFDFGVSGGTRPAALELIHRLERADAAKVESSPVNVELRAQNEELVTVSVPGKAEDLSGRTMLCTFTPSGWGISLPCPSVPLP
jgi:subtilisin family serine protease/ribosome modulation factor